MLVYAPELICSMGVSGFQTFKPVFCIYNKLRLHAEMLSYWVNDVIFSRSNPLMSYRSKLNVSNGRPSNPKLTLKINSLWIKRKAQNFASWMSSEYAFKIGRRKGNDFLTIVPFWELSWLIHQLFKLRWMLETCYRVMVCSFWFAIQIVNLVLFFFFFFLK